MKPLEIINQNDDELKLRIQNHIAIDFSNHGFKNFALDKIASGLHISKKTIYKYFQTKEELVKIVLIKQLTAAYSEVITIIQAQSNVVEKFIDLSNMVEEYFTVFNEESIKRLKYHFPQLADYIEQFRSNRILPLISLLLKLGKKKNLILDIPEEIILKVFSSSLGAIAEARSEPTSKFSYHQMFRHAFNMLLNGILTKKGKQLLNYKLEVIK
ncbi:MAG: TetR/AcrR family transcriptional regulator [Ignavibacterium sp.]|nr:TetR/AcrR family transcriptional regulator [Ignavibacterium sp.]